MKNLKDFKKFAISQKVAAIVSGGQEPVDGGGGTGSGTGSGTGGLGTKYCCMDCMSLICGTHAKSVHILCLEAQVPNRAIVVTCSGSV